MSDEGKRRYIWDHHDGLEIYEGKRWPEHMELLVPASELDRLERSLRINVDACNQAIGERDAAEARERELEGALRKIDDRIANAKPTDLYWPIVEWVQGVVRAALNAPAEDEYSYEVEDAEALAELEADEERHRDG